MTVAVLSLQSQQGLRRACWPGGGGAVQPQSLGLCVCSAGKYRRAKQRVNLPVERQLGLKLTAQKHPMPVVVIDHINRTPTEN